MNAVERAALWLLVVYTVAGFFADTAPDAAVTNLTRWARLVGAGG